MNPKKIGDIKPKLNTYNKPMESTSFKNISIIESSRKYTSQNKNSTLFNQKNKKGFLKFIKILLIITIILLVVYKLIWIITKTNISIDPKIEKIEINQSIVMTSWNDPVNISLVNVKEELPFNEGDNENVVRSKLKNKIKEHVKFDIPEDYIFLNGCSDNIIYSSDGIKNSETNEKNANTKIKQEAKTKPELKKEASKITKISAEQNYILFNKKSLENFLINEKNHKDSHILNIGTIKCSIQSNLADYLGQNGSGLIYNLEGTLDFEYFVNTDYIYTNTVNSNLSNSKNFVSNQPYIQNYTIKNSPLDIYKKTKNKESKFVIKVNYTK